MRNIESLYRGSFARSKYVGLGTLHVYRKEIAVVGNRVAFGFSTQRLAWATQQAALECSTPPIVGLEDFRKTGA